jgi:hypothetical protein
MKALRWVIIVGWAVAVYSVNSARLASADDWPQWMGPNRDNVWRESGIIEKFPEEGLKVLWRTPLAGGYAGPAVADGRVFVTDLVTTNDVRSDNAVFIVLTKSLVMCCGCTGIPSNTPYRTRPVRAARRMSMGSGSIRWGLKATWSASTLPTAESSGRTI